MVSLLKCKNSQFKYLKILVIQSLVLLFIGLVNAYAQEILNERSGSSSKQMVVIGKFENKSGADEETFNTLRSRITNDIVNTRKFDVLEREHLETISREVELVQRGVTTGELSTDIGKFETAGYMLYGDVLSLGLDRAYGTVGDVTATRQNAVVEIQLRIADLRSGKILASKQVVGRSTYSDIISAGMGSSGNVSRMLIEKAIEKTASKVVEELMELAFPTKIIKITGDLIFINLPKERANLNDVYDVFALGDELIDPDTGESLGLEEIYVGKIKIVDVKPKFSVAEPLFKSKIENFKEGMIVRRENIEKKKSDRAIEREKKRKEFEERF
ncbi:MAG: CsgG/HfaB family protein [Candidatus Hydrogenedentes bacterium]|nr:CsgG/HfaB family protein [Candidatus Hydrogenedentota bacterium]